MYMYVLHFETFKKCYHYKNEMMLLLFYRQAQINAFFHPFDLYF